MQDTEFRPSRIIRAYGTPAYGIFTVPCGSIEEAVREGTRLAENRVDFEENFTVVYWFEGMDRDFVPVPSELVEAVKREVLA